MGQFFNVLLWEFYGIGYDAISVSLPHRYLRQEVIKLIDAQGRVHSVMDVGCGTGTLLLELSSHHSEIKLSGIDFSWVMLTLARIKKFLWNRKITFSRLSISELDQVSNESANVVVSVNAIFATNDPAPVLTQINRILTTNGRLVLVTPSDNFSFGRMLKLHRQIFRKLTVIQKIALSLFTILTIPLWIIVCVANVIIDVLATRGHYQFGKLDDVVNVVSNAGFKIISQTAFLDGQELTVVAQKMGAV
ncbi:MAG: class I SAM-dependent methyltransferase [Patescibacteria group bacterium]|jgi:ubiquinone/menaquinone biosynthesis C-methylase UbiE